MGVDGSIVFPRNTAPAIVCYHSVTRGHLYPTACWDIFFDRNEKTPWFGFDLVTRTARVQSPFTAARLYCTADTVKIYTFYLTSPWNFLTGYH